MSRLRRQLSRLLVVVALVLFAAPVSAADFPVKVTATRVGLPAGSKTQPDAPHIARFASWAPVYVDLELAAAVNEPAEIVIEAPDPDEITTTLAVPLDLAGVSGKVSAADRGTIGYVRPAGTGEITITVRKKNGEALSEPFRVRSLRPRDPLTYVVLSLGTPFNGFDLPKAAGPGTDAAVGLRGGRLELAAITDYAQLPDHWFGYEGADLVVLNTGPGTEGFLRSLFGPTRAAEDHLKGEALREWVRRGGRLVVAVGANAGLLAELSGLRDLLPFEVQGARTVSNLALYWSGREASNASTLSGVLTATGPFPIANLRPRADRTARILIPPPERQATNKDITAGQAAYGLGRVTVVGFDLDRPPFTDLSQKPEFWDWVLREGGASRASTGNDKPRSASATISEDEDEVAIALRTHTDTFDGVPVVSFGWVALLIVAYILLIGPIEYFFLKRVLGRLELTWITFPIIVLTVSLAAYYSAYSIKGRELKVNKIDVVDVDPTSGRVYGTTWFTLFSPRIDTYTIGVTPGDGWGDTEPGTTVSWAGGPRGARASLLHRSYAYHTDADALEKVPVQVWSTKSFVANWSGRLGSGAAIESHLEHPPGDRSAVIGTFVNRLPVPVLSDCVVFYAGQAYPLPGGTLRPGEEIRLVLDRGVLAQQWLQKESGLDSLLGLGPAYTNQPGASKVGVGSQQPRSTPVPTAIAGVSAPLLGVLFHESSLTYAENVIPRNASLRRLDQSWRLTPDNRSEVILVGRATPPAGAAEETLCGPNSPSRLWLKGLPGSGERSAIPGTGHQETWVRVYLPVH